MKTVLVAVYMCVCVCGGGDIPVTVMVSTKLMPGVVLVVIY